MLTQNTSVSSLIGSGGASKLYRSEGKPGLSLSKCVWLRQQSYSSAELLGESGAAGQLCRDGGQ